MWHAVMEILEFAANLMFVLLLPTILVELWKWNRSRP